MGPTPANLKPDLPALRDSYLNAGMCGEMIKAIFKHKLMLQHWYIAVYYISK